MGTFIPRLVLQIPRDVIWVASGAFWSLVMTWFSLAVDVVTMALEISVHEFGSTYNIHTCLELRTATVV
jgi:hypothetical protein